MSMEWNAITDRNYANSTSILLHNYSQKPPQPPQATTNVDTNTLVKSVVNDMTMAEKGGQWLLSSYAPFKEKPAFPGFEDHSMEEIRYLFYEAMRNGSLEQYKQNLQVMLQQAVMKIKALQNPSPDAVNMLKNIYNTPLSTSFGNNQTPFSAGTSPIFGGSQQQQQQKSVFGGATSNQNVFGPQVTSASVFGGSQKQQPSIFGGSSSVFGGNTNTNSGIFGGPQTSASKSVFGNTPQQTTNPSIFGGNNSVFGPQPAFSPFSQQPQQTFGQAQQPSFSQAQQPAFGQAQQPAFSQAQQPSFGQAQQPSFSQAQQLSFSQGQQPSFRQPQQPSFSQPQQQNVFQQVPNSSQFGGQTQNNQFVRTQASTSGAAATKPSFQHTTNIFGNMGMQQANTNVFGGGLQNQAKPNEEFYSKIEELTEEEIKWFQSDDLDVSKIPEKPPTYEMCFKV